jgi:uncharacterized protein YggL (DUF469 family)
LKDTKKDSVKFVEEAMRIIDLGQKRNVTLRLMGGFAIRIHCPKFDYLYDKLQRMPAYDLDFVTYSKFRPALKSLFTELGYTPMASMALMFDTGRNRKVFQDEVNNRSVDVFFDRLEMCHVIDFKNRLELDSPTITLSDLLLQKAQICKINEKDIKDMIIMLREHELGETEKEAVNMHYIAKLLSNDWGFWYTVTTNLNKVKEFLGQYETLTEEDRNEVKAKIDKLVKALEDEPKTFKWKVRAKIGTSKKWYTEVEELVR